MSKKREKFLVALESEDPYPVLLEFYDNHLSKQNEFDFNDFLVTFPRKDLNRLWTSLYSITLKIFEQEQFTQLGTEEYPLSIFTENEIKILKCLFLLFTITIHVTPQCPDGLMNTIIYYHNHFFSFPSQFQDLICICIEKLWATEYPNKEQCIPATVTYLILKSLQDEKNLSYIKRLKVLEEGFTYIDIDASQSTTLKALLLKCSITPSYIMNKEGRQLLSGFFLLSPSFSKELYLTILNNIINAPLSVSQYYGSILLDSWLRADLIQRAQLENNIIQNLVTKCVHANNTILLKSLLELLNVFNKMKVDTQIDDMLFRIYDPIIWRSLTATNARVRQNSVYLFINVFPLKDNEPNPSHEDENIIQKQFDILFKLLSDVNIHVRVTAIEGVFKILYVYWELVPISVSISLLKYICMESIYDISSYTIRVACIQGISYLLDNPLSFRELKPFLSNACLLICDKNEKVRIATLKLLLKISKIKSLSLFSLVSTDILLNQVCEEEFHPKIIQLYTELLLPIFWPRKVDGHIQIFYILNFIYLNKNAAGIILKHSCKIVGPSEVSKLIVLLLRSLSLCIKDQKLSFPSKNKKAKSKKKKQSQKRSQSDSNEQEKENSQYDDITQNELPVSDLQFQGDILENIKTSKPQKEDPDNTIDEDEIIDIDVFKEKSHNESIAHDLEKIQQYLIQEFNNDTLLLLYDRFRSTDFLQYIYSIISFFPPTLLQQECEEFYDSILSISVNNNWTYQAISNYIFTIFSWNLEEEFMHTIINVIHNFIASPFDIQNITPSINDKQQEERLLTITKEKKPKKKHGRRKKKRMQSKKNIQVDSISQFISDSNASEIHIQSNQAIDENDPQLDEEIHINLAVQIFEVIMKLYIDNSITLSNDTCLLLSQTFDSLTPLLTVFIDTISNLKDQLNWESVTIFCRLLLLYCKMEINKIGVERELDYKQFSFFPMSYSLASLTSFLVQSSENVQYLSNTFCIYSYSIISSLGIQFLYQLSILQLTLLYTSLSLYQYDDIIVKDTFSYMSTLSQNIPLYYPNYSLNNVNKDEENQQYYSFFIHHNIPIYNKFIYILYTILRSLPHSNMDPFMSYIYIILSSYPIDIIHLLTTIKVIMKNELVKYEKNPLFSYLFEHIYKEIDQKNLVITNIYNDLSTFQLSDISHEYLVLLTSSLPLFKHSYDYILNKLDELLVSSETMKQYTNYVSILFILYKVNMHYIQNKQCNSFIPRIKQFLNKLNLQINGCEELGEDQTKKEIFTQISNAITAFLTYFNPS